MREELSAAQPPGAGTATAQHTEQYTRLIARLLGEPGMLRNHLRSPLVYRSNHGHSERLPHELVPPWKSVPADPNIIAVLVPHQVDELWRIV